MDELRVKHARVAYGVLDYGGFLGMSDKYYAIPWRLLSESQTASTTGKERLSLNIDRQRLKNAPGFDKKHWPNMADEQWAMDVHKYYNQ